VFPCKCRGWPSCPTECLRVAASLGRLMWIDWTALLRPYAPPNLSISSRISSLFSAPGSAASRDRLIAQSRLREEVAFLQRAKIFGNASLEARRISSEKPVDTGTRSSFAEEIAGRLSVRRGERAVAALLRYFPYLITLIRWPSSPLLWCFWAGRPKDWPLHYLGR